MNNNIGFKLGGNFAQFIPILDKFAKKMTGVGSSVKLNNSSMAKAYPHIRKMNMGFTNLTKDANRATKGLNGLTGGFLNMRRVIGLVSFYAIYRGLGTMIQSAMDMIETANLFSVALGELALETNETAKAISAVTGLDLTNIQTSVGTFSALSKSMGMTQKQAQQLSTTTYRLALDLASLYNVDINQALGDLRSGLVGQSETVYKYGIDVTEASLKTEALNQGITKSVRNMSQGEKMALRYAVMIRQTGVAQGDFARTINQPANQLRILTERITTLGRSIGTIFIPVLKAVLPFLNAFVQALTMVINRLALLFGYDPADAGIFNFGGTGLGNTVSDAEDLDGAMGGAEKSAKKLKGQLMGFDEINLWTPPSEDSGGGGSAGTGAMAGGVDMSWMENLTYDSQFDTISQKSEEMVNGIIEQFKRWYDATYRVRYALKNLWDEGLSVFAGFAFDGLMGFYERFLVPVGSWVIGEGLPKLINLFNDHLLKINWQFINDSLNKFWDVLAPFTQKIGEGLLWFLEKVLMPINKWAWDTLFPKIIEHATTAIEAFSSIIDASMPTLEWLYKELLVPLAQWTGGTILEILDWLIEKLKTLSDWVLENKPFVEGFIVTVLGLAVAFGVVKTAVELFMGLKTLFTLATGLMSGSLTLFGVAGVAPIILLFGALIAIGILVMKNWDLIKESATIVFTAIGTFFDTWWGNIEQGWADAMSALYDGWTEMWRSIGNFFVGVANSILSVFEGLSNGVIDMINDLIFGVNVLLTALGSTYRVSYIGEVELPKLPKFYAPVATKPMMRYANGGLPEYGEMFIAREAGAELVGNIGGKTGVMNNDQIVEAVSAGVYSAVTSALAMGGSGNSGGKSDVILEIDGVQLGRVLLPKMNNESTRLGYKPMLQTR